jgi:Putative DNA-binding domain
MSLRSLQQQFFAAMRKPQDDLPENLALDRRVNAELGFGIYRHAYQARLREALANDHAVLATYLGDSLWQQLCAQYITAYPSTHRSLRYFGNHLATFLPKFEPLSGNPEATEIAAFERALLDCFDAADANLLTWEQFAQIPPELWPGTPLRALPSLRLHAVRYNSVEIWQALKAQATPPEVRNIEATDWLLWRDQALLTRFRALSALESAAVNWLLVGGDFAGWCELFLAFYPVAAVPGAALSLLQQFLREGWIANCQVTLGK